jgi:hypothetical protein
MFGHAGSRLLLVLLITLMCSPPAAGQRVALMVQDDEARAALALLDTLAMQREPSEAAWQGLWRSEGYRRLQRRETAVGRSFTDASFAAFLHADTTISRRNGLRATLQQWQRMNGAAAATQALAWLPAGARIHATIYPLIKPKANSFVFESATNPAIMLFLDPDKPLPDYTNTVVHELHHIGFASVCVRPSPPITDRAGQARMWLGAFGEGLAMLAAANGPGVNPHATGPAEDRARWDRDVKQFDRDLGLVSDYLSGVLDGRIAGDSIAQGAGVFYGV